MKRRRRRDVPLPRVGRMLQGARPSRSFGRLRTIWKELRAKSRRAREGFELAAQGAIDGLWDWDLRSDEVAYSERWKSGLGFDAHEIGTSIREWLDRVHSDDVASVDRALNQHLAGETPHFEAEYRMRQHDGSHRWMAARGVAERDREGRAVRLAGSQTDIHERKIAVEELMHSAFHDGLTGLPNRAYFMSRLNAAMAKAARKPGFHFAVMFVDLDRFKVINDTLGHVAGDLLLVEVGRRLEQCVRPGDTLSRGNAASIEQRTLARMGGDEFTILIEDVGTEHDAAGIAQRVETEISRPFEVGGRETHTSVSIGIALSCNGFESADDLIRDADAAMYRAKQLGRSRYEICDEAMHGAIRRLVELESDLRVAVERDELALRFQPIVELKSGRPVGFEALVRWEHPRRGLVSPGEFIPIAEESGLIREIGEWVLRETCRSLQRLGEVPGEPWLSFNVSARQLVMIGLPSLVAGVLDETGVDPARLKVEVTESAIIANAELAAKTLDALRSLGVSIAIDDFGTGYSSFSNLMTYPVDTLKIDQSFIAGMEPGNRCWKLVETMVPLASILGKQTVAEGVQDPLHLEQLRALGCDYGQGYLFAQPMPLADARTLLESGRSW